jgi:hypothetical protein
MKKLLFALLLTSTSTFAQVDSRKAADAAQEKMTTTGEMKEGWTKGGILSINLNHTSNDSWTGASQKYNLAINGSLNYFAYKKWDKNLWKNDVLLAYGVNRNEASFDLFQKNDDRLVLSSMFARQIKKNLYSAAALDINTQVAPGFNYDSITKVNAEGKPTAFKKTSNFLSPGAIRLGIGVLYQPKTNLSVYFSPLTMNMYTKLDKDFLNTTLNAVEAGEKVNVGFGSLLKVDYFTTINKTFTYKTRFAAFTDYLNRPFDKVDLDWTNSLMFNATKYIGVKFDLNFRYYEGQNPLAPYKIQILEMLGVGFAYKF